MMREMEIPQLVESAVHDALRDALLVEPASIVSEASIMDDLGAESIDLLDIRFRLEQALGVRITNEDLVLAFSAAKSDDEFRRLFTVGAMCDYLTTRLETDRD